MPKFKIAALIVVGYLLGDAWAVTRANERIYSLKLRHEREMEQNRNTSFEAGHAHAIAKQTAFEDAYNRFNEQPLPSLRQYTD